MLDEIIRALKSALQSATEAADQARDTATDVENAAENKYDTLGLEAAYLAHGQSLRAANLTADITAFENLPRKEATPGSKVGVGSIVIIVDESGNEQNLFVGPGAGGLKLNHQEKEFLVITPSAPLGQALLGCSLDDELDLILAGKPRHFEIIGLS